MVGISGSSPSGKTTCPGATTKSTLIYLKVRIWIIYVKPSTRLELWAGCLTATRSRFRYGAAEPTIQPRLYRWHETQCEYRKRRLSYAQGTSPCRRYAPLHRPFYPLPLEHQALPPHQSHYGKELAVRRYPEGALSAGSEKFWKTENCFDGFVWPEHVIFAWFSCLEVAVLRQGSMSQIERHGRGLSWRGRWIWARPGSKKWDRRGQSKAFTCSAMHIFYYKYSKI